MLRKTCHFTGKVATLSYKKRTRQLLTRCKPRAVMGSQFQVSLWPEGRTPTGWREAERHPGYQPEKPERHGWIPRQREVIAEQRPQRLGEEAHAQDYCG